MAETEPKEEQPTKPKQAPNNPTENNEKQIQHGNLNVTTEDQNPTRLLVKSLSF